MVGQTPLFHLGFGSRLHHSQPLLPERLRGIHMGGIGDGLMPRPTPRFWSGT
jgi:hypothetical protein